MSSKKAGKVQVKPNGDVVWLGEIGGGLSGTGGPGEALRALGDLKIWIPLQASDYSPSTKDLAGDGSGHGIMYGNIDQFGIGLGPGFELHNMFTFAGGQEDYETAPPDESHPSDFVDWATSSDANFIDLNNSTIGIVDGDVDFSMGAMFKLESIQNATYAAMLIGLGQAVHVDTTIQGTSIPSHPLKFSGTWDVTWRCGNQDLFATVAAGDIFFLSIVYKAGVGVTLYLNGNPVDTTATTNLASWSAVIQCGALFGFIADYYLNGSVAGIWLVQKALTDAEMGGLFQAMVTEGTSAPGSIMTVDENGNVVFDDAPITGDNGTLGATFNITRNLSRSSPTDVVPDNPDDVPGVDGTDWIIDQAYMYGESGASFVVQPNTWTTIPWPRRRIVRQYNNSTETVAESIPLFHELTPAFFKAGDPYAIHIPHDMQFFGIYDWWQICLRMEGPMVEPLSSRNFRWFETKWKKTLLESGEPDRREDQGLGNGGAYPYLGDQYNFYASAGFDGWGGAHDNYGFFLNSTGSWNQQGDFWLPGHASGFPKLVKGMRIVSQVRHDAAVPITLHMDGDGTDDPNGLAFRPHAMMQKNGLRSWGDGWNDWPADGIWPLRGP